MQYAYKSTPFTHQATAFETSAEREFFALLMEQGTGKSKVIVDTASYLYEIGKINLWVVAAPNGVHRKWLTEDIPMSLPDRIPYMAAVWRAASARAKKQYERLFVEGSHLRIFLINTEALSLKGGVALLKPLLQKFNCLFVIDESGRIKNPSSQRTENIINLGEYGNYRRILNGLPVSKSPFDIFSQFQFLQPGLLGTNSYYAFKSQYADFLPVTHPMVKNIVMKNPAVQRYLKAHPELLTEQGRGRLPDSLRRWTPDIVVRDDDGRPRYKNLHKLRALIDPHSFRVTKDECFDLPPKVFQTRTFRMVGEQERIYRQLEDEYRTIFEDELVVIQHKIVLKLRLHQVACGYLPVDGEEKPIFADETANPRVKCVLEELEEYDGQQIIWCRFKREVAVLASLLGDRAVTYYGDTPALIKPQNLERFKSGEVDYLIGTAASGGIGHNFANSSKGIYCSNNFDYEQRKQSEDRQHRYGLADTVTHVLYVDIQAENSVDQEIVDSLRMKMDLADYMMQKKVPNNFFEELFA